MQQTNPREPILSADDRQQLARLLGMCGSNSDNEALAAARLADRLVRSRKITWFDVVGLEPPEGIEDGPAEDWREAAQFAARHGAGILTGWEVNFCRSIVGFVRTSRNQKAILRACVEKLELVGVAP